MVYTLRDNTTVEDIRLDRLVEFDDESRNYPVCAVLDSDQQTPVTKHWYPPANTDVLNQGVEGACVGMGITNDLRFYPVAVRKIDATFAREKIYWEAQRNDRWAGGSYPGANPRYEGTSVLAGMQAATTLGYYGEYRWAFSEPEMALGVSHKGPAIIGINWTDGMFKPDAKGFLRPTGAKRGGHCVLVCGINRRDSYYTIHNSWGPTWGNKGYAKITRVDMATLLAQQGECAIVTERLSGTTR